MIKELFKEELYKTDKFTSHAYLETYEKVLALLKNKKMNLLEIGVEHGGSVLFWRDYFVNSEIYGVDIKDMPEALINSSKDRLNYFKGNAYDIDFINNHLISRYYDIIIDDGPHTLESMNFFAQHYSKLLAPGGIMIIEDIPVLEWTQTIKNNLPNNLKEKAQVVDLRHINNRWDDILLIVKT
jgi:cephalosporin hydroxylase